MKLKQLVMLVFCFANCIAHAQTTAFTYQGRLNNSGTPANGNFDFVFAVYDDVLFGTRLAGPVTNAAVAVANGTFTTTIDLGGGVFTGGNRWLEIFVRTNGSGALSPLNPRQPITSTPYAIQAANAANATTAAIVTGNISDTQLSANIARLDANQAFTGIVNLNNAANSLRGGFIGNGASVTNLNASSLASGAVPDARLSSNVALQNQPANFTSGLQASILSGGRLNIGSLGEVTGLYSSIAAGYQNTNRATYSTIVGGYRNMIRTNSPYTTIAGGSLNLIDGASACTIAGGEENTIQTNVYDASIGGGRLNSIQTNASSSVIAGGDHNTIQADSSGASIVGGSFQTIQTNSIRSAIGGGSLNTIEADSGNSTIGGGNGNKIQNNGDYSTIAGGFVNTIQTNSQFSFIGGGYLNTNGGDYAAVPGGRDNFAAGDYSFAAGRRAKALHQGSFVWGDSTDADIISTTNDQFVVRASEGFSFIGPSGVTMFAMDRMGQMKFQDGLKFTNAIDLKLGNMRAFRLEPAGLNAPNIIGGGAANWIAPGVSGSIIAGGGNFQGNSIEASDSFIAGGYGNGIQISADKSSIGGGYSNVIETNATHSVIGGGYINRIQRDSQYSVVSGGGGNIIQQNSFSSTIAGGVQNLIKINSLYATIGGGNLNTNSGDYATVPGGWLNYAQGDYSFAAGRRAKALHQGSFVWGDSTDADITSTTNDQFVVRAAEGFSFIGPFGLTLFSMDRFGYIKTSDASLKFLTNTDFKLGNGRVLRLQVGNFSLGPNIVGGGDNNSIDVGISASTIAGGGGQNGANIIQADHSFIGGGYGNQIGAGSIRSTISGGQNSQIQQTSTDATIGGGSYNKIENFATAAAIGGGGGNVIQQAGGFSVIAGGTQNIISTGAIYSAIGGGNLNTNAGDYATVPGGQQNYALGDYSFAAGRRAKANHNGSFVWADSQNADFASGGTNQFLIRASGNVGINKTNPATALDVNGVVTASSFVGGIVTLATNLTLNTSGGADTLFSESGLDRSSAGATTFNIQNSGAGAMTLQVDGNTVWHAGNDGTGSALDADMLDGISSASFLRGDASSVVGPGFNLSFGSNAKIWADVATASSPGYSFNGDSNTGIFSPGADTIAFSGGGVERLRISSSGNVGIGTNNPAAKLEVTVATGQSFQFRQDGGLVPGINVATTGANAGIMRLRNAMEIFPSDDLTRAGKLDVRNTNNTATITLDGQSGQVSAISFNPPSDRNMKENFASVDTKEVLAKVAAMPITRWNYKQVPGTEHVGPMAQDFHAAFGVGTDDKHIATVDADGVALAAIQGLNQLVQEKDAKIADLEKRLSDLEKLIRGNGGK